MPVKIVNTPTSVKNGEINKPELEKMKNDFINEVDIKPYNGRIRVIKKFACFVTKDQVDALFEENKSKSKKSEELFLKINFSVNLNPLQDICGDDTSDNLTAILEVTDEEKNVRNQVGNYVLI